MNRTTLLPQAEYIINAINKFRCIRLSQLQYFLPNKKYSNNNTVESVCHFIKYSKNGTVSGDFILAQGENRVRQDMIDAIWTAIDYIDDAENTGEILRNAFQTAYPVNMGFLKDSCFIKVITLESASDIVKIVAENEKYMMQNDEEAMERNKDKILYLIVVRDSGILNDMNRENPAFPHKIAFLTGEYNEKPEITYYSK